MGGPANAKSRRGPVDPSTSGCDGKRQACRRTGFGGGRGQVFWQRAGGAISCRLGAILRRGREKGPGNPISLVSADLRWPRGQPPMSHPAPHGARCPGHPSCPALWVPAISSPARPQVRGSTCRSASGPAPGPGPEAAYVITAFSRPGELVVIPAGIGAFLTAAAAAGRRVLGLFPSPAVCQAASARLDRDLDPAMRALAQARVGGPVLLLEADCAEAGRAALAITGRDDPGACCRRRASGCCGPVASWP
jgi:hypothetical protein